MGVMPLSMMCFFVAAPLLLEDDLIRSAVLRCPSVIPSMLSTRQSHVTALRTETRNANFGEIR